MKKDLVPVPERPRRNVKGTRWGLAILLVVALTGASGLLEGRLSNRWVMAPDLIAAGQKIAEVPAQFADWELQTAKALDDPSVEMLQCVGSTQRVYRNRKTGQTVGMFLIVGPPGPTAVHTPEICYSSQDYDQVGDRQQLRVDESQRPDDAFWEVTMRRKDLYAETLYVAYAWNAGNGWRAASRPRFNFGGLPLLYKLQVAGVVGPEAGLTEKDPCLNFLRDFLPVLDGVLIRPSVR